MASIPWTVVRMKVRFMSTLIGRIGSAARFSTSGRLSQASAATTTMAMRAGLVHSSSLPPKVATRTMRTAPRFISTRPSQSILAVSLWAGSLRTAHTAIQATTPSGRLTQKTQCQETESVSHPPTIGPRIEAMPNMAPMGAM